MGAFAHSPSRLVLWPFMFSKYDDGLGRMTLFQRSSISLLLLLPLIFAQPEDCSQVDCALTIPICTPDSILIKHAIRPGQCCAQDATCGCDEHHCATLAVQCEPGLERIRVRKATGQLGQCCDQFECRRPGEFLDCLNVV